jgi:mono/diheme cytochrome c family protein
MKARLTLIALAVPAASLATAFALPLLVLPAPQDLPRKPPEELGTGAAGKQGRAMFIRSCAHCHGSDAHGSGEDADGPDLHELPISNARIQAVVRAGIQGEMPSFGKKYTPDDARLIIAYLRSL